MKMSYFFLILISCALFLSGCKPKTTQYTTPHFDPLTAGLEAAQSYLKEGDPQNAILTLEELNRRYSNNTEVLEALAFAHSSQKSHLEAAFYFEEVARLTPEHTHLLLYAAQAYSEEKDWEAAKNCYTRYLQIYPEDGSTWKLLAKSYSALNLPDEAIGAYMQALHEEKGSPSALESIAIGKLYLKKKDYSQANDWYEIALYQAESRPFALLGQAELYYKTQHPEVALKKISDLEMEYPNFKNLNPVIALKRELNRWKEDQALAQKNKLIITQTLSSPPPTPPTELATTLPPSPQDIPPNDQIASTPPIPSPNTIPISTTNSHSVLPSSSTALAQIQNQADALLEANQIEPAIQLYWQNIHQSPQHASHWLKLSQAYQKKGDFKTAQTTALEALRLDPTSEIITLHYLDVLKHSASSDQLLQEFQKAKTRFPQNPELTISYAKAYIETQNNIRNARLICQEFLSKYPTSPGYSKVQQELQFINTLSPTPAP